MKTILAVTRRISDHLRKYRTIPSTNIQERKSRLLMLSLVTGLLMTSAQWADAQFEKPPIEIPIGTPDLVVTVDAPTKIVKNGHGYVIIMVRNALTSMPQPFRGSILVGAPVDHAELIVRFAGLKPLKAHGSNGYQCGAAGFLYVWCNGLIGADDTVTVVVEVQEIGGCTGTGWCGGPVYTDAFVDPYNRIVEGSEENNRAVGATDLPDLIDCGGDGGVN